MHIRVLIADTLAILYRNIIKVNLIIIHSRTPMAGTPLEP